MLDSHEDFRSLFESAPDVLYTLDLSGRITRVNRAFERVTGYTRQQAIGRHLADLVVPEQRHLIVQTMIERMGGSTVQPLEIELVTAAGGRVLLEITAELIFERGTPAGIQGFGRDVTDRRREIEALAAAKAELTSKTEQLADFARWLRVLHRLSTTTWSRLDSLFAEYLSAGCEIFGVPYGAIVQRTPEGWAVLRTHGVADEHVCPCAGRVLETNSTAVSADGGRFCAGAPLYAKTNVFGAICFWSGEPVADRPQSREIVELIARGVANAMDQRRLHEELEHLATHDPLTMLPNRLLLGRRLDEALEDSVRNGTEGAVLFIDLDRFKGINDSLGHALGDKVLEDIAVRLNACMRPGDTLARMGGDEFTAILSRVNDRAEALDLAYRLLHAVHAPCRVDGFELFVTASIGVSLFPRDGIDGGTLLRNADAAMYTAKRRGSDDVQMYVSEDTSTAFARLSIETSLRRALEREEFRLLYQPQVDLQGALTGAEVLLVWLHPEHGRVPPARFIPIAEETGMILPIGDWVLRQACSNAAAWAREGNRLVTAVNVSALQFTQPRFVSSVAEILSDTGLPPDCLELELTESLLLRDIDEVAASLRELRSLGVRIAIDDFGTGYSSLNYIRTLPLDTLKIDQSFLAGSDNDRAALALVRAIVALGHTLGLVVTAEGVETERQLQLVRDAGCDRAQGHLFGVALDAARMYEALKAPQPAFRPLTAFRPSRPV